MILQPFGHHHHSLLAHLASDGPAEWHSVGPFENDSHCRFHVVVHAFSSACYGVSWKENRPLDTILPAKNSGRAEFSLHAPFGFVSLAISWNQTVQEFFQQSFTNHCLSFSTQRSPHRFAQTCGEIKNFFSRILSANRKDLPGNAPMCLEKWPLSPARHGPVPCVVFSIYIFMSAPEESFFLVCSLLQQFDSFRVIRNALINIGAAKFGPQASGPQNSGRKLRGRKIRAASFGAAKFGPQASGPQNSGRKLRGRKIRAASFGAAKFGPQASGPQNSGRKLRGRKIRAASFAPP
uniref:Uncharacterized protein n=1 Tax=Globodera rostochiensis TaxID=31243 RepID=A0A914HLN2_GLORO